MLSQKIFCKAFFGHLALLAFLLQFLILNSRAFASALYILRDSPLPLYDGYREAPIHMMRRNIFTMREPDEEADEESADSDGAQTEDLALSEFVPSLIPVVNDEADEAVDDGNNNNSESDGGEDVEIIFVPKTKLNAAVARRSEEEEELERALAAEAQAQQLEFLVRAAKEQSEADAEATRLAQRALLQERERQEQLADELEYISRAEQLRNALRNRRETLMESLQPAEKESGVEQIDLIFDPAYALRTKRAIIAEEENGDNDDIVSDNRVDSAPLLLLAPPVAGGNDNVGYDVDNDDDNVDAATSALQQQNQLYAVPFILVSK